MKTILSVITSAAVATAAYGTSAAYAPEHGDRFNLTSAHQEDEGTPRDLLPALQQDEGTPQNLVAFHREDEGTPNNLIVAFRERLRHPARTSMLPFSTKQGSDSFLVDLKFGKDHMINEVAFNPQDRFLITIGGTLTVTTQKGDVIGLDMEIA